MKKEKGVSLVELVLVVAAVGFLALLVSNLPSSISSINKSRHASLARDIAGKQMDYLRRQTYANLSEGTESFFDSSLNNLPGALATYEIEECPLEVCLDQESAKEVKVKVIWNESGDSKSVELVTIVGEGGIGL